MIRRGLWLFYFALLSCGTALYPQLSGSLAFSWFFDDNPERIVEGEQEFVHSAKADLGYRLFNREAYIVYSGNYNLFTSIKDRTFQLHSLGAQYSFSAADSGEENVSASAEYSLKRGTGIYADYDYDQFSGEINGRFPFSETVFVRFEGSSSYKKLPALNELVHFENSAGAQFSFFFETGTGIFLSSGMGFKNYSYKEELVRPSVLGAGSGKQSGKTAYSVTQKFSVSQFRGMVKVSQAVFDELGVNLHYLYRRNTAETKGTYAAADFIYSGDDELWDDPYGFSSNETGMEFTWKLPFSITTKISIDFANRHYTNNLSDSLNLSQRIDERAAFWGGVTKSFENTPLFEFIEVNAEYMYVNNKSNTGVFSYKNNLFLLGFRAGF